MRRLATTLRVVGEAMTLTFAALASGLSIVHAGYDSQQNRAPAARIALAALALFAALAALRLELVPVRLRTARRSVFVQIGLLFLSLCLLLAWWVTTVATGRL